MEADNMQAVISTAMTAARPHEIANEDGGKTIFHHESMSTFTIPALNPSLPDHVEHHVDLVELESFADYINRFKSPNSVVFARPHDNTMLAAIDYHKPSENVRAKPDQNRHTAKLTCVFDERWKAWRNIDGKHMNQMEFAYFIEENMHTIAAPDGMMLLEMAQGLKINRGVIFKSNRRLANGNLDVEYSEKDATEVNGGHFIVPEELTLLTPIYLLRPAEEIKVKLRYRFTKGEPLVFIIDILNREFIEFEAFKMMADEIQRDTTQPVYLAR